MFQRGRERLGLHPEMPLAFDLGARAGESAPRPSLRPTRSPPLFPRRNELAFVELGRPRLSLPQLIHSLRGLKAFVATV